MDLIDRLTECVETTRAPCYKPGSPTATAASLLGLTAEVGECTAIVQKFEQQISTGCSINVQASVNNLLEELGDVLWFTFATILIQGGDPKTVIKNTIKKLYARHPSGYDPEELERRNQS